MADEKKDNKLIVEALDLISGDGANVVDVMNRVKIMYTAVLCRAMAQLGELGVPDKVKHQDKIISSFIGASREIITALRDTKQRSNNGEKVGAP